MRPDQVLLRLARLAERWERRAAVAAARATYAGPVEAGRLAARARAFREAAADLRRATAPGDALAGVPEL